jgi:hypothetical protein
MPEVVREAVPVKLPEKFARFAGLALADAREKPRRVSTIPREFVIVFMKRGYPVAKQAAILYRPAFSREAMLEVEPARQAR